MYESELDNEDCGDLPDDLPTYEELAFGNEWIEDEPSPGPERPRNLGFVGLFLLFCLLIGILLSLLSHQQYDAGYVNGERDVAVQSYSAGEQTGMGIGYQDGEHQGKLEANVALQEWEYSHRCAVDTRGFVALKIVRGSDNQYSYECVVKQVGK